MVQSPYVHGYTSQEAVRLADQAGTLAEILHSDSCFPQGSHILEAGCGTGEQTTVISTLNPSCRISAVDISSSSLEIAKSRFSHTRPYQTGQITFLHADIHHLPWDNESFDHVLVCFVLEHLTDQRAVLLELIRVLRPGGTITVIEGDHGSVFFSPPSEAAIEAIHAQVELQHRAGGDACIGRRLYPILEKAGFSNIEVSPRMIHVNGGKPHLIDGFTRRTFTAMIEGVREEAIASGLISKERFDSGIQDLLRTCEPDGTFNYCFFKARAFKQKRD